MLPPSRTNHNRDPVQSAQAIIALAAFTKTTRKPILRNLLNAASLVRLDRTLKNDARELRDLERTRQDAEAVTDLHDSMERWIRGDDPIFGFPSEAWKAWHPQMNYHLQRIRHREQHAIWGASRLPACRDMERATVAFLNGGGDVEETCSWSEGLEEEFLDSLIRQWKSDTGF